MTEHTARFRPEDVVLSVLCTASGPVLWWTGTSLIAASGSTSALHQMELWLAGGLAGVGLVLAAWWTLALCGALLAAWGTRAGHAVLVTWGQRISPAFLRRVAVVVLGVQAVTGGSAWAAPIATPGSAVDQSVQQWSPGARDLPGPGWSDLPAPTWLSQAAARTSTVATLIPASPLAMDSRDSADIPSPGWAPRSPQPPAPGSPRRSSSEEMTVTVRQGDCLWDIAAEELGPYATDLEIDRRWRDWHRANEHVIGTDPHRLIPGTVLTSPAWT